MGQGEVALYAVIAVIVGAAGLVLMTQDAPIGGVLVVVALAVGVYATVQGVKRRD